MVLTYDDPIKRKSRERQRDFIQRHLSFKKPEDIRVVCFPGAEIIGQEGLEIKEVYDFLGIPRENIIGLETDSKKARRLSDANLGIQVYNGTDLDFFTNHEGEYDVISLDYTGYRDPNKWKALHQIAGNQRLYRNGILITNYFAKREHRENQAQMIALQYDGLEGSPEEKRQMLEDLVTRFHKGDNLELRDLRDGLTARTLMIMRMGTSAIYPVEMLCSHPDYKLVQEFIEKLESNFEYSEFDNFMRERVSKTQTNGLGPLHPLSQFNRESHMNMIREKIRKQFPGMTKGFSAFIVNYLVDINMKSMFPRAIERIWYTSNKNARMEMDLIAFKSAEQLYKGLGGKIRYDPRTGKAEIDGNSGKKIISVWKRSHDEKKPTIPPRKFLGSSFVPLKNKEKISKEDAIELLRAGFSPKEIAEEYRGLTKMQIAALKAHHITGMRKKNPAKFN